MKKLFDYLAFRSLIQVLERSLDYQLTTLPVKKN